MNRFIDTTEVMVFPLSFSQRRLWTLAEVDPNNVSYNIPFALHCRGRLDREALRRTLADLLERHEILRTSYQTVDDEPVQLVHPTDDGLELSVTCINEAVLETMLTNDAARPFDLRQTPVFRAHLYQLKNDHHVLSMVVHHIACDGWSVGVLLRELTTCYNAYVVCTLPELPELPLQYADYAEWEQAEAKHVQPKAYWQDGITGAPTPVKLPGCGLHEGTSAGIVRQRFPACFLRKLEDHSRKRKTTLFVSLLASFMALLHRLTHANDIFVGVPVANRSRNELENLVGYFVNTLVLRSNVSADENFDTLVDRCRTASLDALEHQHVRFEQLLKQTQREGLDSVPFSAMFALQNAPSTKLSLIDLEIEQIAVYPSQAKFDLTLILEQDDDSLTAIFEFRYERILPELARAWMGYYQRLLEAEVFTPHQVIGHVRLIGGEERAALLGRRVEDILVTSDLCTHFESSVSRHGARPAVSYERQILSYVELDEAANRLAWRLRELGVGADGQENLVGLSAERSPGLVVGMLGILKAGGTYVPLDPAYPSERLAYLVKDSGVQVVVGDTAGWAALGETGAFRRVCLDEQALELRSDAPPRRLHPQQAAYVIYTSGSTGQPKGCVVSHANVVRLFAATRDHGFSTKDVWTLFHSYAFDFSVWEVWGALLHGGRLVVVPYLVSRDPEQFAQLLEAERVSVLSQTPAAFRQLLGVSLDHAYTDLRLVVFGGEVLEPNSLKPWYAWHGDRVRLVNMYGITETTVHVTEKTLAAAGMEQATSVIGEPLKDLILQVLDRYGEPVPTGVAGEIYVGGAGVTRGYLGRAALTAQRFVPDPYGPPGARLYRSGDVARRLPDGGLVYLGRADQQIKLRGFRIELGEVEAALRAQEGVQDAVVMLDTLAQGDPSLVAYVTGTVEPLALRGGLSRRLPGHMVPALIMPLERFPLTVHGKLDCKALPRPGVVATSGQAPRTDVEKMLARIWAEALHIPEPGIDDNFFSLGGDSINALQVVAKARAAGIAITPKLAMLATTIRKLAAVAGTVKEAADQGSSQPGPLPMLPIVAWFQTLELSEPEHWNQALALELRQPVVVSALARALTVVGQHHDAFRLRLDRCRADGLYLDTAEEPPLRLEVCSLQSDEDMDTAILKTQQGLDLVAGPIARALLIQRERQPDVLLLVAHHIAVDAVSWHILLSDLSTAVTQTMQGVQIELPPVPTNLRHYGEMLLAAADRSDPKPWLGMVAHGYPRLPRNSIETALNTEERLVVEIRELDTQSTTLFLQLVARGSEARASALLCAALWLALGKRQLAVTMEHNGRNAEMEADLSRTVGWFTSLYPFYFESSSSQSCPAELLAEMEYALLKLAPHKLYYGLSRWLGSDAGARATLDAAGLPELSLNYLGVVANESQGIFSLRPDLILGERAAANMRPFALDLVVVVLKGKLQQRWLFADGLQRPETVAGWADAMQQQLKDLLGSLATKQLLAADFPLAGLGQHQFDKLVGKRLVTGVYPLSPLQEGILFHSLAETNLQAYHEQVIALLERLDPDIFIRAWRRLLARHDILRSSFHWEALARPLQVVQAKVEQSIEVLDWRCEDEQQRLAEYLEQDSTYGFELSTAPLMRIMFARIGADRWRWVWSYHHILMDGWSLPLLMGELLSIYQSMTTGWETELVPPVQFGSYIAWLVGRSNHDGEAFWRHTLSGLEKPTLVATHQEGEGGSGYHELLITPPPSWEQAVQDATRQVGVSLGSLFQAAWALFLSLSGHGEDVVFGTTMSCRDSGIEGIERMIGLFINTLPLRLCMRPEMSVHDLLRTVQQAQAEVQEHSYDRLVDVQRWSNLDEGEALFDNVLVIENYPAEKPFEDDFGLRLVELFYREHSHYPVTLAVLPDNGLRIKLDYNLAYLGDGAAAVLMQRLVHLVSELAGNLERSIGTFSLLDAEDKQSLHEWNDGVTTAEPANLAQNLFESWAVRQPHATALLQGENRIDYCQLDQRANVLAKALQQRCVGPERVVAVILPRSPEVVIALLAILKAGGVYLPLDPIYPAELLNYMLRDSQAMLLLSVRAQPLALLEAAPEPLFLDEFDFLASAVRVSCPAQQDNLAYLIYTSGSTGQPKPVGVTHAGIANLRRETERALSTNARCRVYMFAPLSFDASVWEVIMALFSGGTLVLADGGPGEDVATALTLAAARHAVTHVLLPPALLGALSEDALPSVHTLIVGGDVAAPGALARWARSRRVFNAYGPSESTICVTIEPCTITTVNPPLGRPLCGILIYLLDPWGNPVPPGIPGEIYLGGVGLARGYHRRPALTAESFVPDHLSGISGARLYRTGDIGRHLPDGRIVYVNRIRGHAKLRGNRINLNGVEQLLRAYPTVREALAMISVVEERQTLVAYVLTESEFESTELRAYMAEHVAAFEVPGIIVPLPAWPLTPAGKIDRKALPDPSDSCQQAPHHKSELTPAEAILLPIWSQLLGRVDLDVHDDYFALGGDSITALHIASRAREQGLGVEPRMVLQQRTIYSLATSAPLLSLGEQEPEHAEVVLAPIQHWYFEQELPAIAHWNLSVCLKLQSALEPELLQRALDTLVEIHPALRLRFERAERGWRQSYSSAKPVPLKVLSTGPVEAAAIEAGLHASFDLSDSPLLCAVYRPHGVVGGPELQLIAHHLVVDTWSLRVLVDDFASAYKSLRARAEIKLLREVESYRRWTERLTSLAADFVPELAYWRAVLATVSEPERLPRKGLVGERRMLVAELDADTSAFLVGEAHQAYRSRGQELLLSALAMAWQHWCDNAQLVVDMETHGREGLPGSEMDLSRTVGWFTALFPVRIEVTDDWPNLIDVVKRSLRDIPNGGLGYGVLRYLHAATELRELVAPAISFNYLGRVEAPAVPALGIQLSERETGPTQAKEQPLPHTLGITLLIFAGRLRLSLVYADPAADSAMQELLDHYFAALHALAEHCRGAERGGYQSSDFSGVHLNEAELNALLGDLTEDDE